MWLVGWQQEDFSGLESDRIACNGNFRFSFNGLYQSVEGRGVFAESWPWSKAKTVTLPLSRFRMTRLTTEPS